MNDKPDDDERNRLTARAARYARVGGNIGTLAAKAAGQRFFGIERDDARMAGELAAALGGLKGPIMKVAQLLSTIPEALPKEYAAELSQLQSQAPPMGPAFVRRRMIAELGPKWAERFLSFGPEAAASASLGQVHRATSLDGRPLAVKLQYPDMQSAVEADLAQLRLIFALHARMDRAVDTAEIISEISARLREELDYVLEAGHMTLYGTIFSGSDDIQIPSVVPELSTRRLLTMTWLDGKPVLSFKNADEENRNRIALAMFKAWWFPFSHYGVIHGDPHLGNYSVIEREGQSSGLNLLDFGCIRTFPVKFVGGVVDLYRGLLENDRARIVHAYETWGFEGLSSELIDIMNVWAKFIYGPLLDDRVRRIAEDVPPGEYGRREMAHVHRALKEKGPVKVPREFVFMDRAAIGLGGVFLHLGARANWYRLFNETIEGFDLDTVAARQRDTFARARVPLPQ